ncbi:hypothetical protein FACS189490_01710 [Clostridia bacterium]|nr:hypothetical protein FACS189490_01710 [Clostridia bacterium]
MSVKTIFNDGWSFSKQKVGVSHESAGDWQWEAVNLPHDWLVLNTNDLYETAEGWYKKTVTLKRGENRLFLRFGGIYMDSAVFINGKQAHEWKYGYTTFEFEITDFVTDGENEILVRSRNESPNTRWYSGAGIYRSVYLRETPKSYIIADGVYVAAKKEENNWVVYADAEIAGEASFVTFDIPELGLSEKSDVKDGKAGVKFTLNKEPRLWGVFAPNLYELTVKLDNGDAETVKFGFKHMVFSPNGFTLNGEKVKMFGACEHHDLGLFGAAVNYDALNRQLSILKDMGVNAIRTSHNPPTEELLELADTQGFLVIDEFADMWELPKTKYDYARFFPEWHERDVAAWVSRDRNHACIIMWSIGNEIADTNVAGERGPELTEHLCNLVRKHDYRGIAPTTFANNYMWGEPAQKCAEKVDIVGYNYAEKLYAEHREKHPDWVIYGSETSSVLQSRGVYHFPLSEDIITDDDLQCSALGNTTVTWGARHIDSCIVDDFAADYSLGQFIWTGFDYIGEPTPYSTKNSYFGQIDTAGFPKDSYYVYKSAWTSVLTSPMVHIIPSVWDFSPNQPIDVRVCSNAPEIELFLNGKSLGKRTIEHRSGKSIVANFIVPYEAGELLAVAYYNGKEVARDTQHSFSDAVALHIETTLFGSTRFVELTAVDEDGYTVKNANNFVTVTGTGLLGLDNGDSSDYDRYKSNRRRMFNGKLLAVVSVENDCGFTLGTDDVPIRNVILRADGAAVTPETLPKNATHKLPENPVKLTDIHGVPINVTESENADSTVDVYARCPVYNGRENPAFISVLPFTLAGYTFAEASPYEFIQGVRAAKSKSPLRTAADKGVYVEVDNNWAGFDNLDFGERGSDTVTLSVFPIAESPVTIGVWDGTPDNGRLITELTYTKERVWGVCVPETFVLPEVLTGKHTISFVFSKRIQLGGFTFVKKARYSFNAADYAAIYGDMFVKNDGALEKIGNNVTVKYAGVSLSEKLSVKGRAAEPLPIVVLIEANGEQLRKEFNFSAGCGEQVFNVGNVPKEGEVTFIFLRGDGFSFESFQFLK